MKILGASAPQRRALVWQVIRYGLTGLAVTAIQAAIYWTLAAPIGLHPQIALVAGFCVAVIAGYVLHGAYSFPDDAREDRSARRAIRFVAVSLVSLGINAFWVWLCVTTLGWPEWSPIPAFVFVTPAIVFVLNRQWVFR
ncbi:GtrA family protein [Sphingobium algorifonticola]|uniref:GtrA family protein n=1 Tax=Sphingobium algorifonticola TaxID=2008318 RepID=A0A437J9G9_9SPHN|nr:GtrA family protein [Sphingobium algorifonticola]RVT42156.1 GtrA family protein [Sphingobium algorifonticola]